MSAPLTLRGQVQIGGQRLFADLCLTLQAGQWCTLLGPSGVGKSTLLRLIAGLPIAGDFQGVIENRRPVAMMAQDPQLLPWLSLRQNVCLGARLRGERPDAARLAEILARSGLSDHAEKRPAALSGGQRQRAALARVLMEDRPLVLLDEPFSALDVARREIMQDLAAELLAGRMVVMVSHDPLEAARLSQQIVVLSRAGLTQVTAPPSSAPRRRDAPDVLACQNHLLARLLQEVAPCAEP